MQQNAGQGTSELETQKKGVRSTTSPDDTQQLVLSKLQKHMTDSETTLTGASVLGARVIKTRAKTDHEKNPRRLTTRRQPPHSGSVKPSNE
mmetsp:Transcript_9968/g.42091  ORF Transcript_9968/g.42091 Transcript_9968/m.42091 type:complete len:91 (-) Transcript_9968:698-970(-)